jgi:hypothetical protein
MAQGKVGEAGADVPGVRQPVALVVHGQQQRADGAGAAARARLPTDNDDLLRLDQRDSLSGATRCRALSRSGSV